MRILALSLAIGWSVAATAIASDCKLPPACTEVQTCGAADHCGRCGRKCECEKHCSVVCEMKEVKKTVWVVKCEDFCTSMPNCGRGCNGCGACDACTAGETCGVQPNCNGDCEKKCGPCAAENNKQFIPPKCGKVRTKKTLEKKEVVCKVPSYKCVVIYSCSNCTPSPACDGQQASPAPAKPAAPAPVPSKTTQNAPMPPSLGIASAEG